MRGQWQGEQWWQELDSPRRKEEWPAGRGVVRKGRSVGASAQRPEIRVSERTEQGGTCPNSRRRERKEQTWPPPDGRRESQASSSKQVKAESLGVSLLGQHSLPGGHHRAAGGRGQWEIHSEEGFSEPWGQRLSHQGPGYSRLLCYVQEGGKGKRIRQPRPQGRQSLASLPGQGECWDISSPAMTVQTPGRGPLGQWHRALGPPPLPEHIPFLPLHLLLPSVLALDIILQVQTVFLLFFNQLVYDLETSSAPCLELRRAQ